MTIGDWDNVVLLDRYPELGFQGAMFVTTDAAWSSSSLSSSRSCLLLAESSRPQEGRYVGPGYLGDKVELCWCLVS
jgi:hypothetical protein